MFHTPARNPSASPTPIRTRGATLTSSSGGPVSLSNGATRNVYSAVPGSRPNKAKMTPAASTVSAIARTGEATTHSRDRAPRGSSSSSRMADAAHQQADLGHGHLVDRTRRREPPPRHDRDAIA